MDPYVRALLAESAAMGRSPLERPAAAPSQVHAEAQVEIADSLLAAIAPRAGGPALLPQPPPSIHEGGFRNYPTPREPAFGDCASANPPCDTHYIGVPGHFGALPYLRGVRGTPRRLLIALHGSHRPSWGRHPVLEMYVRAANVARRIWGDDFAIVAPAFQRIRFKPWSLLEPWTWYWLGGSRTWGYGNAPAPFDPCHFLIESAGLSCAEAEQRAIAVNLAIGGYTGRPSSFVVLDELIRHEVASLGAKLEYVCLVGHSHGGQAVQRYALLDRGISDHVQQATGKPLRYVAMNAGGYAYLTAKRWITPPRRPIGCHPALPDNPEPAFWTHPDCEGYDDWPLGLSGAAEAEARGVPLEAARQFAITRYELEDANLRTALAYNFAHKDIHILQSALDDDVNSGATCGPVQQGCSRRERMQHFKRSLFVDMPEPLHDAMVVVARNCREIAATHPHSSASMFRTPTVREILLGRD